MALKIVTGGTTGAADGTLVSSGNPLVIVALNTAVDAHIRCDDGYWSNDQDFDVPAELEVSFDAGSTWYDNADEPITAPEIYAVNVPIKIRQTVAAGSTSGSFVTDGTYTAIAALSTPTLTVTPGDAQNALSWTNVSNEDASPGYTVESSADGSSWSAETTTAANVTTYTDTGLTNGVIRYYRVKAEGSGRYSDSGWGTGNGTPVSLLFRDDLFTDTDGTAVASHTPNGSIGLGAWTLIYNAGGSGADLRVKSNRILGTVTSGAPAARTCAAWLSGTSNADCAAEIDAYLYSTQGGAAQAAVACRVSGASYAVRNGYRLALLDDGSLTLAKLVAGTYTSLGTYAVGALTVGATYTLRVEAIGTAIKGYVNGVQRISVTDSALASGGQVEVQLGSPACGLYTDAGTGFGADAVRLYNA